jgi:hypothetical protein
MKASEHAERLVAELESHGIGEHWLEAGGKHNRLYWRRDGRTRFFVFPTSPGDVRGIRNSLSDLRKELGVKRVIRRAAAKPPRKPRERRVAPVPCPALSAPPDPFAALTALASPEQAAFARIEARVQLALYRLSMFPGSFKAWKRSISQSGC